MCGGAGAELVPARADAAGEVRDHAAAVVDQELEAGVPLKDAGEDDADHEGGEVVLPAEGPPDLVLGALLVQGAALDEGVYLHAHRAQLVYGPVEFGDRRVDVVEGDRGTEAGEAVRVLGDEFRQAVVAPAGEVGWCAGPARASE